MYVGLKMITKFVTITPQTLVRDADRLMEEQRLWMLLVIDAKGRLIGYVNKDDIRAALPSQATTLERHELNYLLSKLTVDRIMREDVTMVSPETEIEEAAEIMYRKNLAGLAVVCPDGRLVGFINRSVMLDVLVEEMGLRQGGARIAFEAEDRPGVMREMSGIISDMGVSIIAASAFFHDGRRMLVFRLKTPDPGPVAAAIAERGYALVDAETFRAKWADVCCTPGKG
ncbi:acetoin utilization protein AcuB [Desulfobaculum xiamenense]|uniref:Acetoin utilization protein AcuB n=1 Tax=Desulfobaculum xiamenense TaxID=995050 RepID=A0A846QHQ3_9BACT|nr:CBS domain-containing protein [Desulfobaculum xiamenense]NJB66557.1 acetoin utilization protein AcuB [Desulfobaculum xiamenense]